MADAPTPSKEPADGCAFLLPLLGPLVLFAMVGGLVWSSGQRTAGSGGEAKKPPATAPKAVAPPAAGPAVPPAAPTPVPAPVEADWQAVDWSGLTSPAQWQGWAAEQGAFRFRQDPNLGGTVLEQLPEPMTEGLLRGLARFSHGGVRARMSGEAHRRTTPRFSVGLEGRRPFHLRAAPTHRRLELVTPPEVMLAQTPWEWRKDRALWLELVCLPQPGGGVRLEGRAWAEGDPRPSKPQIVREDKESPGRLSPSVRGGPFALKPIVTERLSVLKLD